MALDLEMYNKLSKVFKPHPWHGIPIGDTENFTFLTAFIEITPTDTCKYEMDKETGYLMIDRPQKFSNTMPCLYGFVPQTYCDKKVAKYTQEVLNDSSIKGDGDALDICVLTDRDVPRGDLFLHAKVIGGFRMLDGGEADDKIIAVLKDDAVFGDYEDVAELPKKLVEKLRHYFLTYKGFTAPGEEPKVKITHLYGAKEARKIARLSNEDYLAEFGELLPKK